VVMLMKGHNSRERLSQSDGRTTRAAAGSLAHSANHGTMKLQHQRSVTNADDDLAQLRVCKRLTRRASLSATLLLRCKFWLRGTNITIILHLALAAAALFGTYNSSNSSYLMPPQQTAHAPAGGPLPSRLRGQFPRTHHYLKRFRFCRGRAPIRRTSLTSPGPHWWGSF
jgi:hypothetical protein